MANTYDHIFTKGPESVLPSVKEDGKIRFTTDTGRLFVDDQNARTEITDFIKGMTEDEIKSQLAPLANKIYISSDSSKMFIYDATNDKWDQIAGVDTTTRSELDQIQSTLSNKVDKINGKGLSTNDYDNTEKTQVANNASAITAIKDGTNIDSFADVETALADKADTVTVNNSLATKQNITDNTLQTQDKTISGAINELNVKIANIEEVLPFIDTDTYGFIEHCDTLSSTQRIEYIGMNKTFTPLTVNKSTGSYSLGDWGSFPIIANNKPYMVKPDGTIDYQLDENDYTKKLDGTASDIANESYDGGAFSWIQKIYKKEYMVNNDRYVLFSFEKRSGFEPIGFINTDGKELTGRWLPMFYATVVNGVAKSIATGNCITGGNKTTDAQHNAVVAFNANAHFLGGSFMETMIDLMIMFAKNANLQEAYGYGNCNGYVNDSSVNYGMIDNQVINGGQFYGTGSSGTSNKSMNKAFHSIVLNTYNTWLRDPYEVIKYGEVYVSKNYNYDPTGNTYEDTGISVPNQSSDGWRYTKQYVTVPNYGSIPDISVGGASTSLGRADGTYTLANQSGSVTVCLRVGYCGNGLGAGPSARGWNYAASGSFWDAGFALLLDGPVV